jgi:predicted dehydrogenase
MSTTRLAIIGAGVIGKRHLATIQRSGADVQLVAVVDATTAAEQVAVAAGVPFFQNTESMLDSIRPDGVVVATPTEHHLEPTIVALEAGAHVLVEKPIVPTLEEAAKIIAVSEQTGKHVLVGHHRRYYAQVHKARELVQGGSLGQLITVSGQWNMRKNDAYYDPTWRRRWQAGPVVTNLIHDMDALRYICGEVSSVSAETSNLVLQYEKEDAAAMVIRFKSGALGTFIVSDQANSPWSWEYATGETDFFPKTGQNSVFFSGSKAALEFPNIVLWHHGAGVADWNHPLQRQEMTDSLDDAFLSQINHFCAVIRGELAPRITAEDATATLKATLAVFESANTGRRVLL